MRSLVLQKKSCIHIDMNLHQLKHCARRDTYLILANLAFGELIFKTFNRGI